jgi:phage baseplate assembly protein W
MAMVDGASAVRQSLMLLLSTQPGERIMRPEFGCDLHRLVFEPNDQTTAGLAMHYVRTAIARWEPRVEILGLDAEAAADDLSRLDIVLDYRVRVLLVTDRIVFPVSMSPMEA